MYFVKKWILLNFIAITLILTMPSVAMMSEKQACQIMDIGAVESVWKIGSSYEQRIDICKEIITFLKNNYQDRDDPKGVSFCEIYTGAFNKLFTLTQENEEGQLDSLEIFMTNLTTNLSQAGELLKFESIPLDIYKLRKAFFDKINFTKGLNKILQLVNCNALNNKVFITFDKYCNEGYNRVRAPNIPEDDKLTTFRLGIFDKTSYVMVGLMDIALAATYQQFFLDNLGVTSVSNNSRAAYLGEIIIDEEYRGQGYSSNALKLLNEVLDALGAEFAYLQVVSQMPYTASIYKKVGYILTENSIKFIQENSYKEEGNKLKKLDIKKEEAETKFLENSSICQPYMVRYRYGVIPK